MSSQHLVIIGGGMSASKLVAELVKENPATFRITLVSDEKYIGYNRILLSSVLSGEKTSAETFLQADSWYAEHQMTVRQGVTVTKIRPEQKQIYCTTQGNAAEILSYDKLIIATGSLPFILPIEQVNAPGVFNFRTLEDIESMMQWLKPNTKVAVIGAGLLGLEAANGLARQGAQVTVVHLMDSIMERQLNKAAAKVLQAHLHQLNIDFLLSAASEKILVNDQGAVAGLAFKDGSQLAVDMIVMAVGIRPNIALAQTAGLTCQRGIVVDAQLRTSEEDIFALGECVQFEGQLFGLVAPVYQQAQTLAQYLMGYASAFAVQPTATQLKVSGIQLFSAGDISEQEFYDYLIYRDDERGIYKRISVQNNQIKGVVMCGDAQDGAWYFDLLQTQKNISAMRSQLMFGQAYCE